VHLANKPSDCVDLYHSMVSNRVAKEHAPLLDGAADQKLGVSMRGQLPTKQQQQQQRHRQQQRRRRHGLSRAYVGQPGWHHTGNTPSFWQGNSVHSSADTMQGSPSSAGPRVAAAFRVGCCKSSQLPALVLQHSQHCWHSQQLGVVQQRFAAPSLDEQQQQWQQNGCGPCLVWATAAEACFVADPTQQ
jgi:hypothetical protein